MIYHLFDYHLLVSTFPIKQVFKTNTISFHFNIGFNFNFREGLNWLTYAGSATSA